MSNKINLKQFNETPSENLNEQAVEPSKRGRKSKYTTDEERKEARRKQQREYRLRRKQELEKLREMVKDKQE